MFLFKKDTVALCFQNYALFPNMTVKENIACAVQDKTIRKQKTEQIVKTYDLMELADVYPSHLSGGQAQRCAFCKNHGLQSTNFITR